jgi:L-fuculose-phosphate aldolase
MPLSIVDATDRGSIAALIEIVPYAPSGTWLLARALKRRLRRGTDAYLLRNHGLICCGATMQEALANTDIVERVAARFLRHAIELTGAEAAPSELAVYALAALQHAQWRFS